MSSKQALSIFRETKRTERTNRRRCTDSNVSTRASAGFFCFFVCSYKRSSLRRTGRIKQNGGERLRRGEKRKGPSRQSHTSERQLKLPFVFGERSNDKLTAQSKHGAVDGECDHYRARSTEPNWLFQWHNFTGRQGECNVIS